MDEQFAIFITIDCRCLLPECAERLRYRCYEEMIDHLHVTHLMDEANARDAVKRATVKALREAEEEL